MTLIVSPSEIPTTRPEKSAATLEGTHTPTSSSSLAKSIYDISGDGEPGLTGLFVEPRRCPTEGGVGQDAILFAPARAETW